jgi:hypothetical protein
LFSVAVIFLRFEKARGPDFPCVRVAQQTSSRLLRIMQRPSFAVISAV